MTHSPAQPAAWWGDVDVAQAVPIVGHVNATDDGDEPMGEAPEVTIARVAALVDRQAQALGEIRVWAEQRQLVFDDDSRSMYAAGILNAAHDMLAILDRLGV